MTSTTKLPRKASEDIVTGDTIVFLGTPHRVSAVTPYTHPTLPGAFAVASCDSPSWSATKVWEITLWHGDLVEVLP